MCLNPLKQKHKLKLMLTKQTATLTFEPRHEISNNVVCVTSKATDQAAYTHSLIRAFASRLYILRVLSY